ncbi:MAG: 16S rRNA (cytidine(1402)-2'-O)-methyltransferase [bacterium]
MGTLYVIATPIGNMEDITNRALRILSEADLILCEDTRQTQKLLDRYGIKKPVLSYHQHSKLKKVEDIINMLKNDKSLVLVSDAGTPGISDPGNFLISKIVENSKDIKIIPIPGPSASISAASISGFPMDRFSFLGFPPVKKKRNKFFKEIAELKYPVIFYESPYRIMKTLAELPKDREIVVCRELTKKFETVYRGKADEIVESIGKSGLKGEFVVVMNGTK